MDKSLKNEPFVSISVKKTVSRKFRYFSRKISRSRSMTLLLMIQFFENNSISPLEDLGPQMKSLESIMSSRINNLIAILRNIETDEIKPTRWMLEALFENADMNKEKSIENTIVKAFEEMDSKSIEFGADEPETTLQDIRMLLQQIRLITPRLGKPFYRLDLPEEYLKNLKTKYHVYHD